MAGTDEAPGTALTGTRSRVLRINHTIHAVLDIEAARRRYVEDLGGLLFDEGYFEPEDRHHALTYVTNHMVEPMAPANPTDLSKPYARYLDRYGEGFHSFELKVDDCPSLSARLREDGYVLASDYGTFFYVRPESSGGLLLQCYDGPLPNDPYDQPGWRPDWATGTPSTLLALDHIACVLPDAARTVQLLTTYLDVDVLEDTRLAAPQPSRRVLLQVGDTRVACLQPDDATSGPFGAFVQPPSSGVYALVWNVQDEATAEAFFHSRGLRTTRAGCASTGFAIEPADFSGARHEFVGPA